MLVDWPEKGSLKIEEENMLDKLFETEFRRNAYVALAMVFVNILVLWVAFYVNPLELEQATGLVITGASMVLAIVHHWMRTLHKHHDVDDASEAWLHVYMVVGMSAVATLVWDAPYVTMALFVVVSILTGMATSRHLRDVYCSNESLADVQERVKKYYVNQQH